LSASRHFEKLRDDLVRENFKRFWIAEETRDPDQQIPEQQIDFPRVVTQPLDVASLL
jgi:hypothetical protein